MQPISSIFIAIQFLLCLAAPALADQRLVLFQKKAKNLISKPVHWSHTDHPIGPYIGTYFENGLSKQERLDLLDAHRRVDCITVERLLLKGFHKLYPFLRPAFEDMDMSARLEVALLSSPAGAAQWRCIHRQRLQRFLARHRQSDFPIIDMKRELRKQWHRRGLKKKETEFDKLINIRLGQAEAAFCNDYPPEMLDVLQSANKPGGLLLAAEEELFLLLRSHARGSISKTFDVDIARVSERIPDNTAILRIQNESRNHPFERSEKISGFWHLFCQDIK